MQLTLTPEMEQRLLALVETGKCGSAEEVVAAAPETQVTALRVLHGARDMKRLV